MEDKGWIGFVEPPSGEEMIAWIAVDEDGNWSITIEEELAHEFNDVHTIENLFAARELKKGTEYEHLIVATAVDEATQH